MNLFKYPIETLLGLAGVIAVAAPIYSTMAVTDPAGKAQPAAVAPQAEQVPPPAQAAQAPIAAPLQQPKLAALTEDVWQPERATPDIILKHPEKAPPAEKPQPFAKSRHPQIDELVATHAKANNVPEALVHRVIVRESRYQPDLIGRGGAIGLMQIKLATARGLGYGGDAEGLRDPDTNLAYGVKYLAGAYRVANGNHDLAIHYYAAGYYEAAKRWRLARYSQPLPVFASTARQDSEAKESVKPVASAPPSEDKKEVAAPKESVKPAESAKPEEGEKQSATPEPGAKPKQAAKSKPKRIAAKPRGLARLFADAKAEILRPPAAIPGGAKGAKPR